jgi:hypothetical protein
MRIGGPPKGPQGPRGAGGAAGAKGVGKAGAATFQGSISTTRDATEDQAKRLRTAMMQELEHLAAELEHGKTTKEEASRRFVGLVIREKFGRQKGKGAQQMEDSVGDLVEADPAFVAKLHSQLKKLGSK